MTAGTNPAAPFLQGAGIGVAIGHVPLGPAPMAVSIAVALVLVTLGYLIELRTR